MMHSRSLRIGIGALIVLLVGITAFFGTRIAVTGGSGEATQPSPFAVKVDTNQINAVATADRQRPRYVGQLLGMYIGATESDWPQVYRDERQAQLAGGCVAATPEQGAALDFSRPVSLPAAYVQSPAAPNVVVCSGRITGFDRSYQLTASNGLVADVTVARSVSRVFLFDAAAERVSPTAIGGRPAILVRPATNDAVGQRSDVIFPEPFGSTFIVAFNLPLPELLQLAERIAEASK
jgi:hypothetical protein